MKTSNVPIILAFALKLHIYEAINAVEKLRSAARTGV